MVKAMRTVAPGTLEETAGILEDASRNGARVGFLGNATKLGWGRPTRPADVEIATGGMGDLLEHNAPDLTAVVQAGATLASVEEVFAESKQMLPLDPPLGVGGAASIGGAIATADSGPLRHRYGAARDLVLGMTVVLSDGTIARSGGKVIKNVAGYDLAKLFSGSFGTLGLIAEVVVRLRPLPDSTRTAVGESDDAVALQSGARALAHAPIEPEALDVFWKDGRGQAIALVSGVAPDTQAASAVQVLNEAGLDARVQEDDRATWERQRELQRTDEGAVVRVSGLPSRFADVARAADRADASLVGRAALGLYWLRLSERSHAGTIEAIEEIRDSLRPLACVVLDAPRVVREGLDVWHEASGAPTELMRRVKQRFDPAGICNPGVYLGGL